MSRRRRTRRIAGCAAFSTGFRASIRSASSSGRRCSAPARSRRRRRAFALDLAIRMIDLTTLEGQDTPGKVRALCAKALRPDPSDPTAPAVAAVCVYPDLVRSRRSGPRRGPHPPYRQDRERRDGLSFWSRRAGHQARRHQGRSRGRRRRDRHGDRPRRLPRGAVRPGVRRDRGRQGGRRRRPSQGHPRDRGAGDVRQRPARVLAGDARRRRLHQDQHRQDLPGRHRSG